jgi:hypothetical protein
MDQVVDNLDNLCAHEKSLLSSFRFAFVCVAFGNARKSFVKFFNEPHLSGSASLIGVASATHADLGLQLYFDWFRRHQSAQ